MPVRASLAVLVISAAAFAQSPKVGVVAVGLDAASEREALTAERVLLESLSSGRPGATDLFDATRAADKNGAAEKAKQGEAEVAAANESIDALDFTAAVAKLNQAVSALEDSDWTTGFGSVSKALGERAVALHLSGAGSDADAALATLFAVSPNFRFPEGRWSPDVRSWVEAGRQTSQQLGAVSVDVKTNAPASVYVDGIYRGIAPLEVSGLVPGRHYLSVRGFGATLAQRSFDTHDGHELDVGLETTPAARALLETLSSLKADAAAVDARGKELCASAGVDEVVIAGFRTKDGALQLRAMRVAKDGRSVSAVSDVSGRTEEALAAADRTALGLLDKPLEGVAATFAVSAEDLQSRRNWSYVAAGSGAAAFLAGVILGANAQGQVNSARANGQLTNDQYASAVHGAQVTAGVADGFYALAAVGVGLGGWLFYSSLSGSADSTPAKSPEPDNTFGIAPTSGGAAVTLHGHF